MACLCSRHSREQSIDWFCRDVTAAALALPAVSLQNRRGLAGEDGRAAVACYILRTPTQTAGTFMAQMPDSQLADLTLKIDGLVPPDKMFHRRVLFDALYASLPKDPEAKVQIYTAEIAPKGWTNFHCHNGATFFIALQGLFEAHFEEGVLIRAKAGDVYSEPIGKMHRGHNPHDTIPYLCVAFCVTAPDRDHVTNVVKAF
jgi:quercetin dioxygenase-like cupin family protein